MENVNLHEIRSKLKHGDIAIIASRCNNVTTRQVAEVLNKGRDCNGRYDEIVGAALDLLKGEAEDKKVIIAKAKEAGFSTSTFSRSMYRPKHKSKNYRGNQKGIRPVVYVIGGVGLLLLLFGKKLLGQFK